MDKDEAHLSRFTFNNFLGWASLTRWRHTRPVEGPEAIIIEL
jgi:hypothetical protein